MANLSLFLAGCLRPVRQRRLHRRESELQTFAAIQKLAQFVNQFGSASWTGLAPGNQPLFVRDISSQEIYALDVELS